MPSVPASRGASLTWTTVAASLGFVVVQLDVTIVNVALPHLAAALHGSLAALQWVVDAYALAFAALLLSAGAFCDRFGARRAYLIGFAVFALASAACGLAGSAPWLIAARAVQGASAALLVPPSLALLNQACAHDARLRTRAIGVWTAAGGVAIAAGPVIGGLLLESLGWRSIFLINLPLCALGIGLTLRLPETARTQRALDLPGQGLAILALAGLTGAVIEAGDLGWTHPGVLGGAIMALIAGIAFVAVEKRAAQPMLPLRFFRLPNFTPALLFGIAANLSFYGAIFVLSLYLQRVKHYGAARAGLAFLPMMATVIVSNLAGGWIGGRYGARLPMLTGALAGAAGFALLALLDADSGYAAMLPPFLLIATGIGLAVPVMTATVLASVGQAWSGTGSAVLNAARQAAGAMGVAIFGALAAGGDRGVVAGMQAAGWISCGVLLLAWLVVHRGIREDADGARARGS